MTWNRSASRRRRHETRRADPEHVRRAERAVRFVQDARAPGAAPGRRPVLAFSGRRRRRSRTRITGDGDDDGGVSIRDETDEPPYDGSGASRTTPYVLYGVCVYAEEPCVASRACARGTTRDRLAKRERRRTERNRTDTRKRKERKREHKKRTHASGTRYPRTGATASRVTAPPLSGTSRCCARSPPRSVARGARRPPKRCARLAIPRRTPDGDDRRRLRHRRIIERQDPVRSDARSVRVLRWSPRTKRSTSPRFSAWRRRRRLLGNRRAVPDVDVASFSETPELATTPAMTFPGAFFPADPSRCSSTARTVARTACACCRWRRCSPRRRRRSSNAGWWSRIRTSANSPPSSSLDASVFKPATYTSLVLPIVPDSMLDLLEAPVPFVVGVRYKTAETRRGVRHLGVVRVNATRTPSRRAARAIRPRRRNRRSRCPRCRADRRC